MSGIDNAAQHTARAGHALLTEQFCAQTIASKGGSTGPWPTCRLQPDQGQAGNMEGETIFFLCLTPVHFVGR